MAKDNHIILGTTLLTSHKRVTQNIAMQSDILQHVHILTTFTFITHMDRHYWSTI
jgi:hypothetical protein